MGGSMKTAKNEEWFKEAIRAAWIHGYRARIDDQQAGMHGTFSVHMVPKMWLDDLPEYEKPGGGTWKEPPGNPLMELTRDQEERLAGLLDAEENAHSQLHNSQVWRNDPGEADYWVLECKHLHEQLSAFRAFCVQPEPDEIGR